MKTVPIDQIKARLSQYIRLVKLGSEFEILEHGVPVARLTSIGDQKRPRITPPRRDPRRLATYAFSAKSSLADDVVDLLLNDREKR